MRHPKRKPYSNYIGPNIPSPYYFAVVVIFLILIYWKVRKIK